MRTLSLTLAALAAATQVHAASVLHVYGPGGPAPAVKEAAKQFEAKTGVKVEVVSGPTKAWLDRAKADAEVIYSGSETMMSDFMVALDGALVSSTIQPLYLRVSSILVRRGNPEHISGLRDLLRPGRRILVVNGAGQNGLWEDMAGRTGDLDTVRALRRNIVSVATSSAEAKATWIKDSSLDAWIIWGIWQVANPDLADQVPVEPEYRIYRDAGVGLTKRGQADPHATAFAAFLASAEGAKIFARWGWSAPK